MVHTIRLATSGEVAGIQNAVKHATKRKPSYKFLSNYKDYFGPTIRVPRVGSRVQVRQEVDHGHHVLGHRVRHERRVTLELDHHSTGSAAGGQAVGQAQIAEQLEPWPGREEGGQKATVFDGNICVGACFGNARARGRPTRV